MDVDQALTLLGLLLTAWSVYLCRLAVFGRKQRAEDHRTPPELGPSALEPSLAATLHDLGKYSRSFQEFLGEACDRKDGISA